jgi:hypothetical protein
MLKSLVTIWLPLCCHSRALIPFTGMIFSFESFRAVAIQ